MRSLDFHIVIPAHNEAKYIATTLLSLTQQTLIPKQIIVVDDNSTDNTFHIASDFANRFKYIHVIQTKSSKAHEPGAKVINAFYKAFKLVPSTYDIICKFDADLSFPKNYLEELSKMFKGESKLGMASGILHIEKNGKWYYEAIADKDHIRGPIKAYRKSCFEAIGGLKLSIGWDTADVLLAKYHQWDVKTNKELIVKHLKPTGSVYSNKGFERQGITFYKLRYGIFLACIASAKVAFKKKSLSMFFQYLKGYFNAKSNKEVCMVSPQEGQFIRQERWKGIKRKLKI